MKWAYHIKHKVKAGATLVLILVTVWLVQMGYQRNVSALDNSVSSIYKDRLMPATYLFDISSHLYEKRLANEATTLDDATRRKANREHDEEIAALISSYETTYLTLSEQKEWQYFKEHLAALNATPHSSGSYQQEFAQVITSLSALNNIQVGESRNIHSRSQQIMGSTVMMSQLETATLIVLGLFALILLSISDKALFFKQKGGSLN